jgi:hypothetical protein
MQLSQQEIQDIIAEIKRPENLERKRQALKSSDVYEGALKKYVSHRIMQMYPKSWNLYTISDYSILKKIVDKKAKAYKEAVVRKLEKPDESTAYQDIVKDYCLNEAMKELDVVYNQYKYALMGCTMDLIDGEPSFNFMPLDPQEFDVIKDSKGEAKIVILSYPGRELVTVADTDGMDSLIAGPKSDEGDGKETYSFWTDDSYYLVEQTVKDGKAMGPPEIKPIPSNPNNVNPWGVLPFVYLPMNGGPNYPVPSPLCEQTVELNSLLSVYLTSGNMQVGQLVIKHPESQKIEQASSGMMTVLKMPQSSDTDAAETTAEYISPNPNMDGHRTSIMTFASLIMDEQGIRPGSGLDTAEKFTSGLDRAISEADVQDIIEANQQLYARVEEELFEIVKAQLASVNRNPFTSENIQVIYRKPKILVTETEVLANLKTMEELGLLEPWEKFVMIDPNLSEEDAKAKLARIEGSKPQPVKPEVMNADNSGPSN